MIKIIENPNYNDPNISLIITENGFRESDIKFPIGKEFDELFEIIKNLANKKFPSIHQILVAVYDDEPASGTKTITFFIEDIEALNFIREIQIEFNKLFNHKNVSISLI